MQKNNHPTGFTVVEILLAILLISAIVCTVFLFFGKGADTQTSLFFKTSHEILKK